MVTVISGLFGVGAAACFFYQRFYVGALLMYLSMMLDCVDGNLARKTGQTSPIGAKLDSITDSVKKVLCLAALTFVSSWNIWLVIALVALHYLLLRTFRQVYPVDYRQRMFSDRNLEPLFSPYDLLVILLFFGPMISFEFALVAVLVLQITASVFAQSRTSVTVTSANNLPAE
jgi:phosphatidylglycerophosphate synthase